LYISVQEYLRVGSRAEGMPERLKLQPKFPEVVNLAVVAQYITPVARVHRLGPCGGQIDDGKPPVPEPHPAFHQRSRSIGSAMSESVRHFLHGVRSYGRSVKVEYPGYPAHGASADRLDLLDDVPIVVFGHPIVQWDRKRFQFAVTRGWKVGRSKAEP